MHAYEPALEEFRKNLLSNVSFKLINLSLGFVASAAIV